MVNEKIKFTVTWIVRILWVLSFVLLLFVKDFSFLIKWVYIGFIIFLTIITIFRIKESQREWYEEENQEDRKP
jgi:large-conductance mechanosensitive channel